MPAIFPIATKGGGECFGLPNVCLTPAPPAPPIPVPYPTIGTLNSSTKFAKNVKCCGKNVLTKKSQMSRSSGDEAGVNKGVVSGMNMGSVGLTKCSSKVKIEGQDCASLTSMTAHNGSNANMPAGCIVSPCQTKVIISS